MAIPSLGVPHIADGRADVRIGGAAADVAAHVLGDVLVSRGVALLEQRDGRHDLARGTVAALERVVLDEGLLHRVELAVLRQPFAGGHLVPFAGGCKGQAGEHAPAVQPYRAGAARALVAAFLRSGEPEVLTQRVEQAHARLQNQRVRLAVDAQQHGTAGWAPAHRRRAAIAGRKDPLGVYAILLAIHKFGWETIAACDGPCKPWPGPARSDNLAHRP